MTAGSVTFTVTDSGGHTATATAGYTTGPATRFPGDPGTGRLYYGLSTGGGDPAAREVTFGQPVGCYRSYWQASQITQGVAVAARDLAHGRLPLVSFKMPATWAVMGNGSQDAWIDQLMAGLATVGGPVWFCPHHEPYDDKGAAGSGMTAPDYVAMCRRFMARKASNVAIMPILQSAPFDRTVGGAQNLSDWYAADSHDVCGLDAYNHWSAVYDANGNVTSTVNKWRTVQDVFSVTSQVVWGKPIAFCEWGVRTDPRTPGLAATWMASARTYLMGLGNVVALAFFDSNLNVNDGGTPWSLDDHGTERLTEFKVLLADAGNARL